MKLSQKQQKDLETVLFFSPRKMMPRTRVTQKSIKQFFDYSDRGISPEKPTNGYKLLLEGKRWRGIHVHELWKKGLEEATLFVWEIADMPRSVAEFVARELPTYRKAIHTWLSRKN